ncbi:hypothetical protein [Zooshikella ganghwensis]|uniref:hypothetical protein n=1 Tax=Zooshikella ganghwensis TaxID=202772 RepID=UPI00041C793D|nr:hypothetical protein [Zooshikella ganghwensis]
MKPVMLSLFDFTGEMVKPWLEAGYECWIIDVQHKPGINRKNNLVKVGADIRFGWLPPAEIIDQIKFIAAFPPCDHLAVSGARWFKGKGLRSLGLSIDLFATATEICEWSGAPYLIENPVSTISTYWRKPDYTFHPWQYCGYEPNDEYTKKTCLWTGGGFVMPEPYHPNKVNPDDRIHKCSPSADRKNIRSITPFGFAKAVYLANSKMFKGLINARSRLSH